MKHQQRNDSEDDAEFKPNFPRYSDVKILSELVQLQNLSDKEDSKENIEGNTIR